MQNRIKKHSVIFNFSGYLCLMNEKQKNKQIVSKKNTKMDGACTFFSPKTFST